MSNHNPIKTLQKTNTYLFCQPLPKKERDKNTGNRLTVYFSRHLKAALGSGAGGRQSSPCAAVPLVPNFVSPALHKSSRLVLVRENPKHFCADVTNTQFVLIREGRSCLFTFTSSRALSPCAKQKDGTATREEPKESEAIFFSMCWTDHFPPGLAEPPLALSTAPLPLPEDPRNTLTALHGWVSHPSPPGSCFFKALTEL